MTSQPHQLRPPTLGEGKQSLKRKWEVSLLEVKGLLKVLWITNQKRRNQKKKAKRKTKTAVDLGIEVTGFKKKNPRMPIMAMRGVLMTQSLSHLRWIWPIMHPMRMLRQGQTASRKAHSTGDFATPLALEYQAMYMAAHRTAVTRMFISLDLADDIVDAIMDKQGFNFQHPSCTHSP